MEKAIVKLMKGIQFIQRSQILLFGMLIWIVGLLYRIIHLLNKIL